MSTRPRLLAAAGLVVVSAVPAAHAGNPACCLPDGSCLQLSGADCTAAGGTIQGAFLCANVACPQPDRATPTDKGSLVVFAAVEIRWNGAGLFTQSQDTFLTLTNDYPGDVRVQLYFVNGDPPLAANPAINERAHPGWNWVDNLITLTDDQTTYWSAATGLPATGGVAPFTVLDPGFPPGRPATDGSTDRVLRGFVIGWAVDTQGNQISWNHLSGNGTIVHWLRGRAWEYASVNYRAVGPVALGSSTGTPGELLLDALQYARSPELLVLNFQSVGSSALSGPRLIMSDTQLTLLPASADLREESEGPVTTKADFTVWNMNEVKFSGTRRCVTCWDQTRLSRYGVPNYFLLQNLQTDFGKARIDGVAAAECDVDVDPSDGACGAHPLDVCSVPAPLLAVAARLLSFDGGADEDAAGWNLVGIGSDVSGVIRYDAPAPPPEAGRPDGKSGWRFGAMRKWDGR